jgi:hypothetical protein
MTTAIYGKRGAWLNQYAEPSASAFQARARQVDYVIIKYGQETGPDGKAFYEALCRSAGVPWLAEKMPERGPAYAVEDGRLLGEQAIQPGCIGAVANLEEADGNWHTDDGSRTRALIAAFRVTAPGVPLFASIDTRGNRPELPYQRVLAELTEGVMPMVYPLAFYPSKPPGFVDQSFNDCITGLVFARWIGKEIHPTIQTYGALTSTEVVDEALQAQELFNRRSVHGMNVYTLGHATPEQWAAAMMFKGTAPALPPPPNVDLQAALIALAKAWVSQWSAIAAKGTVQEAVSLAAYWQRLTAPK